MAKALEWRYGNSKTPDVTYKPNADVNLKFGIKNPK